MRLFWSSLLLFTACPAMAAENIVELAADEEVQMALSAAPEHLRAKAGVYRLGRAGYELIRPSENGFTCLVVREANSGTGPICYDREGSETTLNTVLFQGRLLRQGKSSEEIERLTDAEYAAGRLIAPRKPGIVYMLSNHFRQVSPKTGKSECIFPPHVMFYTPYMKNSDIGSDGKFGSTDVPWILNEGKPTAYILVIDHHADIAACQ